MTEAATQRHEFRAYRATESQYIRQTMAHHPEAVPPPRESAEAEARSHAAQVAPEGWVVDLGTLREVGREAVVVNDTGTDYRPAEPGEEPTGHIVLWEFDARQAVPSDEGDPVLTGRRTGDGSVEFVVPESHAQAGGAVRLRHNLGGEVTVSAKRADGEGIGYLFAATLDAHTVHVEFFAGTATFNVAPDQP